MSATLRAKQRRQVEARAKRADLGREAVLERPGHCRLPKIESVHVPSNRLLGRVYRRKLHKTVCRKDMFRIWNGLGASVASTLLQGKGVRFPGVMDLTFDIKGEPMYVLERDPNVILKTFGSGFHALWAPAHDFLPGDGAPVLATLPLQSVAQSLNKRRDERRRRRRDDGDLGHTFATTSSSRHAMGGFETTMNSSRFGATSDSMLAATGLVKKAPVQPKTKDQVTTMDREVVLHVVSAVLSELIHACRGAATSVALTLDRVGEIVYTAHDGEEGLGGRGFLAVRFRRDFVELLKAQHAARVIREPIQRWSEARRHDKVTVREFLDPTIVIPGRLLEAPGFGGAGHTKLISAEAEATLDRIRTTLVARNGGFALHRFVKQLSTIDDSGGEYDAALGKYVVSLDADELRWGLREFGVEVQLDDCLAVVAMFDADGGGTLSDGELMAGLRGQAMSALRTARVEKKWAQLCRECGFPGVDEVIPVPKLKKRFNPHGDPRVKAGNADWPPRDVTNDFFAVLDDAGDGSVGWDEFFELYENVSAAFADDAKFMETLDDYWHRPPSLKSVAQAARAAVRVGKAGKRLAPASTKERALDGVLDAALGLGTDDSVLDAVLDGAALSHKENARLRPFAHHAKTAPVEAEPDVEEDWLNPEAVSARAPSRSSSRPSGGR